MTFADFVDEVDTVQDRALFSAVFTERLGQSGEIVLGTFERSCSEIFEGKSHLFHMEQQFALLLLCLLSTPVGV